MSVLVGSSEDDKISSYPSEDAMSFLFNAGNGETQWCFSQVKGALDDDVTEGMTFPLFFLKVKLKSVQGEGEDVTWRCIISY